MRVGGLGKKEKWGEAAFLKVGSCTGGTDAMGVESKVCLLGLTVLANTLSQTISEGFY